MNVVNDNVKLVKKFDCKGGGVFEILVFRERYLYKKIYIVSYSLKCEMIEIPLNLTKKI